MVVVVASCESDELSVSDPFVISWGVDDRVVVDVDSVVPSTVPDVLDVLMLDDAMLTLLAVEHSAVVLVAVDVVLVVVDVVVDAGVGAICVGIVVGTGVGAGIGGADVGRCVVDCLHRVFVLQMQVEIGEQSCAYYK